MKISIIQCHRMSSDHVEERELKLASLLQDERKCQVEVCVISSNCSGDLRTTIRNGVTIHAFPVSHVAAVNSQQECQMLVDYMAENDAHLVLFKGLGYRIIEDVTSVLNSSKRTGAIIGGKVLHPVISRFDVVLCELPYQIKLIKDSFPDAHRKLIVLPKLVRWDLVELHKDVSKVYDICNIGQLSPRKNQAILSSLSTCFSIAFAGGGDILCLRSNFPPNSKAEFLGHLSKRDVYRIMSASRINAHVSLYEGVPRAAIESFACGLPLVALVDTLSNAFAGLPFVNLVQPCELRDCCNKLLSSPEELLGQSKLASEWAREKFSEDAFVQSIDQLLSAVQV